MFHIFHRAMLCWIDSWHGMNMQEIRNLEELTKSNLENVSCVDWGEDWAGKWFEVDGWKRVPH